jgi:hypothetical protein
LVLMKYTIEDSLTRDWKHAEKHSGPGSGLVAKPYKGRGYVCTMM